MNGDDESNLSLAINSILFLLVIFGTVILVPLLFGGQPQ